MRAGSSYTNFVTNGNVRQNAQDFNPKLYNNVGAVTGYPGPNNGVAAAAGNPGPEIVMKGGRSPSPGPNYQAFVDSHELRAGVYGKNLAPVKSCNNNMCGGKKKRGTKGKGKGKGKGKKSRGSMSKKHGKIMKHHKGVKGKTRRAKKSRSLMKKVGRRSRKYLKDVRNIFRMSGGSPAEVPVGSQSNGYHQYMGNQPFSNSYSAGGNLAPSENALANPVLIHPTDNCSKK